LPASIPDRSPAQVRRLILSLLPTTFLGAIDGSIVPVALLTIGRALGDVSLIAWVMTGYLVAGTVATPIYGKLSDVHGRRRMLFVALGVSAAGSALCAVTVSMPMLVAARVLQGLGSGALFALAQAASADVVSGTDRARYQGYFSAVFASAALAAPLLGGVLTQHLSWRAVFWINLPLAALAAWLVWREVAESPHVDRDARIDWGGAALLSAGLGVVLVAFARVGQGAGWISTSTLALLGLGAALLVAWVWRESDAPSPIVPTSLFANRVVMASCVANGLNFFVLIGCTVLLPLSMQALAGERADQVAMRLIAVTLATPIGAFVGGRLMLRITHHRRIAAAGSLLACAALAALAIRSAPGVSTPVLAMIPLGFGIGMTFPPIMVAAQGAVGPNLIGTVTALVSFFRSLGGVLGVSVLTSVVMAAAQGGDLTIADPLALAGAFRAAFGLAAVGALAGAVAALRMVPFSRAAAGGSAGARS
jgi:MFS family permease